MVSNTVEIIRRAVKAADYTIGYTGLQNPHVSEGYSYRKGLHGKIMWTAGFWPGLLWLLYAHGGKREYAKQAVVFERSLSEWLERTGPNSGHDLGFQFYLSAKANYQFTGDLAARELALKAAGHLAQRYNERGGFIRAWGAIDTDEDAGKIIIDCMMNLPLLFWAAQEGGESRLHEIALRHAHTSLSYLMREDGTFYHTYDFNPVSGQTVGPGTHQGHSTDSTWSRGQAWAIYGFALAYKHTHEPLFLEASRKAAQKYLQLLQGDERIPPWDFDRPQGDQTVRDSSAAAIAAAGLLELAQQESSMSNAKVWATHARRMLEALEAECACSLEDGQEGLLIEGCYHYPAGKGKIECTSWGDYFYLEALFKENEGISIY
ncbi:glycoside hydrolase family 88 protein [Paenibacillus abyssi]|uniref:Glycosyl hydrolase n=1 Tax=Paenibacillus abyssi TaxID=1340531 RepID=A0A917FQK4_9BACL|nr:glycoside hydrolase family 88 protein [Paenibacillus abyssi]GGF96142.1 glycosyl hydrolase [Paenibacillus abyssi]